MEAVDLHLCCAKLKGVFDNSIKKHSYRPQYSLDWCGLSSSEGSEHKNDTLAWVCKCELKKTHNPPWYHTSLHQSLTEANVFVSLLLCHLQKKGAIFSSTLAVNSVYHEKGTLTLDELTATCWPECDPTSIPYLEGAFPKFSPQTANQRSKNLAATIFFSQEQTTVAVYNSSLTSSTCVQSLERWEELESYLHNRLRWMATLAILTLETAFSIVPGSYTESQQASQQKEKVEYNSAPAVVGISGSWRTAQ